ncbi:hypothetical protein Ddc_15807 [Ditylenchus destructor]|nr:hypothetical protein Ddc_15807 [Ditylenchus destructor]
MLVSSANWEFAEGKTLFSGFKTFISSSSQPPLQIKATHSLPNAMRNRENVSPVAFSEFTNVKSPESEKPKRGYNRYCFFTPMNCRLDWLNSESSLRNQKYITSPPIAFTTKRYIPHSRRRRIQ